MKREANKEAVDAVIRYMSESSAYTFEKFGKENGIWVNAEPKGDSMKISCPFHNDDKPSLYMEEIRGLWHCFSCNAGGKNLISFMVEYMQKAQQSSAGFYQIMNNILLSDPKMQLSISYSTIYRQVDDARGDLANFKRRKFVPQKEEILTNYVELANIMMKHGHTSMPEIRLAILYVQDGYSPTEVLKQLKGGGLEVAASEDMQVFDVNEILGNFSLGQEGN
jgi:hypothetical protein